MFVEEVSAKELREFHRESISNSPQEAPSNNSPATPLVKCKRVVGLISDSPQEDPSSNSPTTPIINVEVKRPRLEVSSSPPVQVPGKNQPCSSEGVDEMRTSFLTEINSSGDGDTTSVWNDNFPFGDLIIKHFNQEKFHEKVKELEFERVLQTSLTDSIRTNVLLRVIGQKFSDTKKENKAYVEENTELKKKLSEYEKNMEEMTSLKDELNKLKKTMEYSSMEKSRMIAREKNLKDENSRNKVKLFVIEDAHKVTIDKLKAEIDELKGKISLQYKAGYEKAVRQVVFFASRLEP